MSNQRIIRGNDPLDAISTRILAITWDMRPACYVDGCEEALTTIIQEGGDRFALCEEHFQEANVPGGTTLNIKF